MFDADTKLREIFARRKQDVPWTPLAAFERIGGPKFLEFIPAESAKRTAAATQTPGE